MRWSSANFNENTKAAPGRFPRRRVRRTSAHRDRGQRQSQQRLLHRPRCQVVFATIRIVIDTTGAAEREITPRRRLAGQFQQESAGTGQGARQLDAVPDVAWPARRFSATARSRLAIYNPVAWGTAAFVTTLHRTFTQPAPTFTIPRPTRFPMAEHDARRLGLDRPTDDHRLQVGTFDGADARR